MTSTSIICSFAVEGIHSWPECDIEGVNFLSYPHRHMFYIKCEKEVNNLDREIEIISFKRKIISFLEKNYGTPCNFDSLSCEMIATNLLHTFKLDCCEVLEDNENGAIVKNIQL